MLDSVNADALGNFTDLSLFCLLRTSSYFDVIDKDKEEMRDLQEIKK